MQVIIDKNSGFCFGVANAINMAEQQLHEHGSLFCLGDIVHNNIEIERLRKLGLIVIDHAELQNIYNTRILIRAHGEPPRTYEIARNNNLTIIEASCPVVLKLQARIRKAHKQMKQSQGQVVIFGKEGHAEVTGLVGQTDNEAIVIGNDFSNIDKVDVSKPLVLFSQTTQDKEDYRQLKDLINQKKLSEQKINDELFTAHNTICGQVSNRGPRLEQFALAHDVVIFVSGRKSSNGKYLFDICKRNNPHSYFISDKNEIQPQWFAAATTVGVCGATSTPMWLMELITNEIRSITSTH